MNPIDFFKYGAAYTRYQSGLIDPGDPSEGGKPVMRTSRTGKQYLGPPDYTSDEQRNMSIDRDTLQLAKTIGDDLTIEEFKRLRDQVEEVHNRYKDQAGLAMTNRNKQEAVWELPEKFNAQRSNPTHFKPMRFADGTPIDWDDRDPAGTQAKLQSVPYEMVKHDPQLRDAWLAAQNGQLALLMESGSAWQASTDPATLSQALGSLNADQRDSLSAPLKALLNAQDSGKLEQQLNQQMATASRQLATGELASNSDKKLGDWLGGKPLFMDKPLPEKLGGGLDSIFDKPAAERKPEEIGKWIETFRAHHDKETRAQVQKNQLSAVTSRPTENLQANVQQEPMPGMPHAAATQGPSAPSSTPSVNSVNEHGNGAAVNQHAGPNRSMFRRVSDWFMGGSTQHGPNHQQAGASEAPATLPTQMPDSINPREAITALADRPATQENQGQSHQGNGRESAFDAIQTGLDAYGVVGDVIVPGTGALADGANAVFSLERAIAEPHRAGEHLLNAGISAVSMIPFVGDFAKVFKYGAKGARAARGAKAAIKAGDYGAATKEGMQALGARGGLGSHLMSMLGMVGDGGSGDAGVVPDVTGGGGNGKPPASKGSSTSAHGDGPAPVPHTIIGRTEDARVAEDKLNKLGDSIVDFGKKIGPVGRGVTYAAIGMQKLGNWIKGVDEQTRKMIDDNRFYGQYNTSVAGSYMKLDAGRIERDIGSAQEMSGPLSRLTGSQAEFESAAEDLTRPFKQVATEFQAMKTNMATYAMRSLDYFERFDDFIDWWYGEDDKKKADQARQEFNDSTEALRQRLLAKGKKR